MVTLRSLLLQEVNPTLNSELRNAVRSPGVLLNCIFSFYFLFSCNFLVNNTDEHQKKSTTYTPEQVELSYAFLQLPYHGLWSEFHSLQKFKGMEVKLILCAL